jgi:competence protein ComEC
MKVYKVKKFFSNGYLNEDIEQKIYSQKISQNDVISISLFNFEVVWLEQNPEKEIDGNENSVAGILTVKDKDWSIFLSGDMEKEVEQKLIWRQILKSSVSVLKVSHHGSESATSEELLEILKPKMAVISVGKNNKFGHPRGEVLEKLKKSGAEILRTDIQGEVIFE